MDTKKRQAKNHTACSTWYFFAKIQNFKNKRSCRSVSILSKTGETPSWIFYQVFMVHNGIKTLKKCNIFLWSISFHFKIRTSRVHENYFERNCKCDPQKRPGYSNKPGKAQLSALLKLNEDENESLFWKFLRFVPWKLAIRKRGFNYLEVHEITLHYCGTYCEKNWPCNSNSWALLIYSEGAD